MQVDATILQVFRHRWNAPVLAGLHALEGAAFKDLVDGLGVTPSSLSRSLGDLDQNGWVRHRTVKRPPYVLTRSGGAVAPPCAALLDVAAARRVEDLACRRWTMPIAAALRGWSLRFGELRAMLPGITPRALTMALKEMGAAGLVLREIEGGFPPSTVYRLTHAGEQFLPMLAQLDHTIET